MKHSNTFLNNRNRNSRLRYVKVKNPYTVHNSGIVWAFVCEKCQKDAFYPLGLHENFPELMICANCYRKT